MLGGASVTASEDEAALLEQARSDPARRRALLRLLYDRHRGEVHGFLVRMLRDDALADDVLHDGFVRVCLGLDRFDGSRPFRPWLFEIMRNAAIDALRRRKKAALELPGEEAAPSVASSAVAAAEASEAVSEARDVLSRLPDETRALLLQRHALDMTQEELAESFQCTERTIRNRLRVAAEAFARELLAGRSKKEGRS
jgi:RNA polymerase sigma-70 factor (ECF subfamily)